MTGGNRLLQPRCQSLPFTQFHQRIAETILGSSPVERHPIASVFLKRCLVSSHCLSQLLCAGRPLSQTEECRGELFLSPRPVEGCSAAGVFPERSTTGCYGLSQVSKITLTVR